MARFSRKNFRSCFMERRKNYAQCVRSLGIVLAKVGDGLVARLQSADQPHHFQVATGFTLDHTAAAHAHQVAVKVKL